MDGQFSDTSIITTEWLVLLFFFFMGGIYWIKNKQMGFQIIYLTVLSMSITQIISLYFPYLHTNDDLLPLTHPQVQITMTFFAYFIPIAKNRTQIIFCLIPPVLISLGLMIISNVPAFSITGAILIGGFIIFTFYRTLDWIGSMPEPYIIVFSIILPVFIAAIISPSENFLIYPGVLLGAGIGVTLEAFKVRMSIPKAVSIRKAGALIIGGSGLIIFYGIDRLFFPWLPLPEITIGLLLGLWITLIVPFLLTLTKIYRTEGRRRILV